MNLRARGLSYLMRIIPVVTVSRRGLALAFGRLVVDEAALPVSASMGILSSVHKLTIIQDVPWICACHATRKHTLIDDTIGKLIQILHHPLPHRVVKLLGRSHSFFSPPSSSG